MANNRPEAALSDATRRSMAVVALLALANGLKEGTCELHRQVHGVHVFSVAMEAVPAPEVGALVMQLVDAAKLLQPTPEENDSRAKLRHLAEVVDRVLVGIGPCDVAPGGGAR